MIPPVSSVSASPRLCLILAALLGFLFLLDAAPAEANHGYTSFPTPMSVATAQSGQLKVTFTPQPSGTSYDGQIVRWRIKSPQGSWQTDTTYSTGYVFRSSCQTGINTSQCSTTLTGLTNGTTYELQGGIRDDGHNHWPSSGGIVEGTPAGAQQTQSSDATLSALTATKATSASGTYTSLSIGTFASATETYTASVATDVTHVKLTPTVNESNATVKVGKGTSLTAVNSGSASGAIALGAAGTDTAIKVEVTAQDSSTKTYTVTVSRAAAQVTPTVSLSVSPNPVAEGSSTTVTMTASSSVSADLTIPLTVTRGTAEAGDYTAPTSIQLANGTTSNTGTISTNQDTDTDDETFTVALGSSLPSGVTAGSPNSVTVTITDDDTTTQTVSLSASPNPVNEGSSTTITATLSSAATANLSIPVTLSAGTAETGDYGSLTSIAISSGQSSGTGTVSANQDTDTDDETFTVALGSSLPSGVTAGSPNSVTVTITDDDTTTQTVSLSASPNPVNEGSQTTITATLSSAATTDLTIPVTVTRNAAEAGDYTSALTSFAIPTGSASANAVIQINQDTDTDDETFTVSLGSLPSGVTAGSPSSVTIHIYDDDASTASELGMAGVKPGAEDGKPSLEVSYSPDGDADSSYVQIVEGSMVRRGAPGRDGDGWPQRRAAGHTLPAGVTKVGETERTFTPGVRKDTFKGFRPGVSYKVRLYSVSSGSVNPESSGAVGVHTWKTPGPPRDVKADSDRKRIRVTWFPPSEIGGDGARITGYDMQFRESRKAPNNLEGRSDPRDGWVTVPVSGTTGDIYRRALDTHGEVKYTVPEGVYRVKVRARNGISPGSWWNEIEVRVSDRETETGTETPVTTRTPTTGGSAVPGGPPPGGSGPSPSGGGGGGGPPPGGSEPPPGDGEQPPPADAFLSDLRVSEGMLVFRPRTLSYEVTVGPEVTAITVTATAVDGGEEEREIELEEEGPTSITQGTYTITVTREEECATITEEEALRRFYEATGGEMGVKRDGGRIVSLLLADSNLEGAIPGELSCLAGLKELALWDNEGLSGHIPQRHVLAVERAALLYVAEALELNTEWFDTYEDPYYDFFSWHGGVKTDDDGRITGLDFSGEDVMGVIPAILLRQLERLETLDIECSGVTVGGAAPAGVTVREGCDGEMPGDGGGCALGSSGGEGASAVLLLLLLALAAWGMRRRCSQD